MTDNEHRFIVIAKEGMCFRDDIFVRDMYIPFGTEFDALRVDEGHILYNGSILPTTRGHKTIILEKECVEDMLWKVVSKHSPIDFFRDAMLTDYVYTFYANSQVIVDECRSSPGGKLFRTRDHNLYFSVPSVFEDHLVEMKNLILGRVCNTEGVILRQTKEIYSTVVGILPYNTYVVIKNKAFSDIPSTKHLKRLQLSGNLGWMNDMSNYDGLQNIELLGICTNPFRYSTTVIKLDASPFQDLDFPKSPKPTTELCVICLASERTVAVIHDAYGHMLYCKACADIMSERAEKCPICRTAVAQYVRMY